MKLVRINSIDSGRFYYVGDSKEEATEKKLKYFIGSKCNRGHVYFCSDGSSVNGCVRSVNSRGCVKCQYIKQKESKHRDEKTEENSATTRRRIEDIKLARELGVSIDDL